MSFQLSKIKKAILTALIDSFISSSRPFKTILVQLGTDMPRQVSSVIFQGAENLVFNKTCLTILDFLLPLKPFPILALFHIVFSCLESNITETKRLNYAKTELNIF